MNARRAGLDIVRSAAIIGVVVSHYGYLYFGYRGWLIGPAGFAGVELFFVLSGFLIGGIFLRDVAQNHDRVDLHVISSFWARRWLRTLPNYLLFVLIYWYITPAEWGRPVGRYLIFMQNFAWRQGKYFDISWSLAVEEWFYLLLPLISLGLFLICRRQKYAVIGTVIVLFVVPTVLRIIFGPGRLWDPQIRKVVVFRLDALMWGVALACVRRFRPAMFEMLRAPGFLVAGLAIALAAGWVWLPARAATESGYLHANRLDSFIFTAIDCGFALMLPACDAITLRAGWLRRGIECVSLWSYSAYLCHLAATHVSSNIIRLYPHAGKGWTLCVLSVLVTTIWSGLNYQFFEIPILRLRDRWFPPKVEHSGARTSPSVQPGDTPGALIMGTP